MSLGGQLAHKQAITAISLSLPCPIPPKCSMATKMALFLGKKRGLAACNTFKDPLVYSHYCSQIAISQPLYPIASCKTYIRSLWGGGGCCEPLTLQNSYSMNFIGVVYVYGRIASGSSSTRTEGIPTARPAQVSCTRTLSYQYKDRVQY